MVYNAVQTPQVVYTPAGGYSQYVLGSPDRRYFSLITWEEGSSRNVWGAPSDLYYNVVFHYANKSIDGDDFTVPYPVIWDTYDAVVECDVYDEVVGKTGTFFNAYTYTNGKINSGTVTVEALDTINKIGHEGRHTSVYANPDYISASKTPGIAPYIITYVDTYLAQVINTWDEVIDPASHVKKAAGAEIAVFSNANAVNGGSPSTILTVTGTGYTVGDLLAVNLANPRSASTTGTTNIISNSLSNANYSPARKGSQIEGKPALSTSTVTVKYILRDNSDRIVGFADTNGNQHYYNYTYQDAATGSRVRLTESDINKTVVIYTTADGSVLAWRPWKTPTWASSPRPRL